MITEEEAKILELREKFFQIFLDQFSKISIAKECTDVFIQAFENQTDKKKSFNEKIELSIFTAMLRGGVLSGELPYKGNLQEPDTLEIEDDDITKFLRRKYYANILKQATQDSHKGA